MKLSLEQKLKILNYYVQENSNGNKVSQQNVADKFKIPKQDVVRILHEGNIYNNTFQNNQINFINGKNRLVNPILKGDE